jgi:hypothetical protein
MALELELETYRKNLPNLLDREGKFVLIYQDQVLGVLNTLDDALREGYERVGLFTPFFIRQIKAIEKPIIVHRRVGSCPT